MSLVLGLVFFTLGGLSILAYFLGEEWPAYVSSNGNLMLGLALIVVGAIFLTGVMRFRSDMDGEAFLIVGCMVGLSISLVTLLALLADASEAYLLMSEDFVDWVPMDDFTPAMPMMIPCAAILWYKLREFKTVKRALVDGG